MRYIALQQWLEELKSCHDKVKDTTFCDVVRSVTVDSRMATVAMKGDQCQITVDGHLFGSSCGISRSRKRDFTSLYNAHREQFSALLEEIRTATESVSKAVSSMLGAMTSDQVPELVMKRMRGEQVDSDPVAAIRAIAGDKLRELIPLLSVGRFTCYEVDLDVAGKTLTLQYRHGRRTLGWGKLSISDSAHRPDYFIHADDIEQCLLLIRNIEAIKDRIASFSSSLDIV